MAQHDALNSVNCLHEYRCDTTVYTVSVDLTVTGQIHVKQVINIYAVIIASAS